MLEDRHPNFIDVRTRRNQIAPKVSRKQSPDHVQQSRRDSNPRRLEVKIPAPSVLVRQHISVASRDGVSGGRQMQIEPRLRVYVANLSPVEAWMRQNDLASAEQQSEKCQRDKPMGDAHQRSVALRLHSIRRG